MINGVSSWYQPCHLFYDMSKRKIKLVIFDLDGTLVDAYQAVSRSLNYALEKVGLPRMDDEVIKRKVGWGEKVLVQSFVPEEKLDETLALYRKHHKSELKTGAKFLPGAKEIISLLKEEQYMMAIASNRPTVFTHIILECLGIRGAFSCILCADKVKHPKPSGDLLVHILENLSVEADEALYVGDMTIDIQTGMSANIKTVAVLTGSCYREELEVLRPYSIIQHIDELPGILERLNGWKKAKK